MNVAALLPRLVIATSDGISAIVFTTCGHGQREAGEEAIFQLEIGRDRYGRQPRPGRVGPAGGQRLPPSCATSLGLHRGLVIASAMV